MLRMVPVWNAVREHEAGYACGTGACEAGSGNAVDCSHIEYCAGRRSKPSIKEKLVVVVARSKLGIRPENLREANQCPAVGLKSNLKLDVSEVQVLARVCIACGGAAGARQRRLSLKHFLTMSCVSYIFGR